MKSQHDQHISKYIKMAVHMNHNMRPFDLQMDATRFWKCAVSACCDPTIRIVGCSPMISMIPSGHQPRQWNNHCQFFQLKPPFRSGISQLAMFEYQRVYQPRGVGCHRSGASMFQHILRAVFTYNIKFEQMDMASGSGRWWSYQLRLFLGSSHLPSGKLT